MDPGELRRLWHLNKHRPAWVREHAAALEEYLTVEESIPEAGSMAEARDWLERHAPTVTRQLDDAVAEAGEDDGESDADAEHEHEDADGQAAETTTTPASEGDDT